MSGQGRGLVRLGLPQHAQLPRAGLGHVVHDANLAQVVADVDRTPCGGNAALADMLSWRRVALAKWIQWSNLVTLNLVKRLMNGLAVVALVGLAQVGCKGAGNAIAVIPRGDTDDFSKAVHAGAEKAAAEAGLKLLWKAPNPQDPAADQIKLMQEFVDLRVKGIVLSPMNAVGTAPLMVQAKAQAKASNIPLALFDASLKDPDLVSVIGSDNFAAGKMAGDFLIRNIGDWGTVIMLRATQGQARTTAREQGFLDSVVAFKRIKVASSDQFGGPTVDTAFAASEKLLTANKGPDGLTIHGVFCPNETTALGMLRALQAGGFAGKVRFVTFGGAPQIMAAIKEGTVDGTVLEDPVGIGYSAVKTMADHLAGKKVSARVDTISQMIGRENLEAQQTKELLNPDLKKWPTSH